MKRHQRLAQASRFRRVYQDGQSWPHRLLVLRALRNDLPHSRFGFVAGKRTGKAVVRNRVKRIMREAMRAQLGNVPPGLDVVLIARAPIAAASAQDVAEAVASLVPRLVEAESGSAHHTIDRTCPLA
jgi:ribonuclease P protein component